MLIFIINPNSGSARGYKIWKSVEQYLCKLDIEYKVYITDARGDAVRISADITSKYADEDITLVAVGGDGTMNEVLEGAHISSKLTMGYIPAGTGNDLARGLRLPKNPKKCLKRILRPKRIKNIDYGIISYGRGEHRRFLVSSGIGFDAAVTQRKTQSSDKKLKRLNILKKLSYISSGIMQLFANNAVKGSVIIDDTRKLDFNNIVFISSHIHPFEGGGFRFSPKADNEDGELSVCIVHQKSKLKLVKILLSALLGNHLKYPGVKSYDCKNIKIYADLPMTVHVDGEICGNWKEVELSCVSRQLRFIV